jgi:hypothetical protein
LNAISKWLAALGSLAVTLTPTSQAAQPVLQRGYDLSVSGATLTETTLDTSNVGSNTFGLVFKLPVDDTVYAQPLYVPNLAIPNLGTHNVLYVATMNDTLYAFDADAPGLPLWKINLASLVGATPVPIAQFTFQGNMNIVGHLGVLSTPVIDPSTNVMYLVAGTLENNALTYRLHAVDITSGTEPYGPGVLISGSYRGATFEARYQLQRVSLALSGNQVVFGFSAIELESPNTYVGWVMAYNKRTLQQAGIFGTVTTGNQGGGVWQSGRPPVVDGSGYVYVFTGNGYGGGYDGVHDFSESALKLDSAHSLNLVDWFTPDNWSYLDSQDLDLSSSGPLLIPGTNLLAGGGKAGELYVLNTANLGKYNASDSQIVQEETIVANGQEIRGGPVYWQRSAANGGPLLYDWGAWDSLKAYAFNGTTFGSSPSAQGGSSSQDWPGGILALSANGQQAGSGVLWATVATSGDAENNPPVPGALYAFDAGNVAKQLWSSTGASRDNFGNFAKFVPPLIASGRVYVATWSNQVAVYGLLVSYTAAPTSLAFGNEAINVASAPMTITLTNTGTGSLPIPSITLSTPSPNPFSQTNTCGTTLAAGSRCTISVVFTPLLTGSSMATLSINAGGGAGTQTVALSGIGVMPTYTVSPASLAFGSQTTNVASAPMPVTVTNTSTVPLPITSITLSTPGSNPFSQTNACGTSVAVGAGCTINVTFNPPLAGSATATLKVNAGGTTSPVSLSGIGSLEVTLAASSQSVTAGVPVTLTWSSTPGASCTASGGGSGDNWAGPLAASGSQSVSEASTGNYSYVVTCTAPGVNVAATVTVTVTLPTVTLSATPTSITVGHSVTLVWASQNSTTCVASGGQPGDGWASNSSTNGTATATPSAAGTTIYTMTCSSGPKSAQAIANITVNAPPSSGGGGGALDAISLLSLLTMIGLRERRRFAIQRRKTRCGDGKVACAYDLVNAVVRRPF